MNKRYLGAVILAPLIIFLFVGGMPFRILTLVLSLLGMYEFYNILKEKQIKCISIISYVLCIIYYVFLNSSIDYKMFTLILILSIFLLLCVPVIVPEYNFIDISLTIFGFLYVTVFFSFLVLIDTKTYGQYLIWLVFLSSWLCDTSAYYTGRYLGRKKLCPKVSPKKTIAGAIGGMLGSILGCSVYASIVLIPRIENIHIYQFIILGALCGVFCQFGDLVASSIKRYVGVKDYSNLIPGHGGILDRFDSILFSSVVVYYFITFVMGL